MRRYKFGDEKLCDFFDNVVGKEGMKLMGRFIGKLEEKAKDHRFRILLIVKLVFVNRVDDRQTHGWLGQFTFFFLLVVKLVHV